MLEDFFDEFYGGSVSEDGLPIGEVARRSGASEKMLRGWEQRFGFPVPERRDSGHRRYDEATIQQVRRILDRRDAGIDLTTAIAEVVGDEQATTPSIFAELCRKHPSLKTYHLAKSTLIAISRAIEDECCAQAIRPVLWSAFQEPPFWDATKPRWQELARTAAFTGVFANFEHRGVQQGPPAGRVNLISLPADAPMHREWVVVCDASDLPCVLSAFEIPGQREDVPDNDRIFEGLWTNDPYAVRTAATACAKIASEYGLEQDVTDLLEGDRKLDSMNGPALVALSNRIVAYVDRRYQQPLPISRPPA